MAVSILVAPGRLSVKLLGALGLLLIIIFFVAFFYPESYIPTSITCDDGVRRETIPNIVHFVYVLKDPNGDFNFQFSHLLSLYAAWHYWQPHTIYLHTNVQGSSASISRAQSGQAGKWNKLIFTLFDLRINAVEVPTHAGNGKEIAGLEHKSDFVRVKAVHDIGGVYIDWDVHPLRDIGVLRRSGFKAIAGRQLEGQINSGTFMTEKGGKMIKLWMDGMHQAYTGGWTTHSNEVITKFGQRLVREPGEMLIMEREAFAPGSWNTEDTDDLFAVRDVPPNPANYSQGADLPLYEEDFSDRWEHPEDYPAWARDWSYTYLLHAFTPDRWGHHVQGFEHITPRYVLERRSNFARAVYPIAREMYQKGLIEIDDTHLSV